MLLVLNIQLLFTYNYFYQGTTDGVVTCYAGRIVFITFLLWSLIMYQFYSADIVGSLIAAPPKFINNLWDLIHSDLHLAFEDIPYTHDYFRASIKFFS